MTDRPLLKQDVAQQALIYYHDKIDV